MLLGTETLTKVSGGTAGHCDGVKSGWNMPSFLCAYRNTVFVCDTGDKNADVSKRTYPPSK